MNIKNIFQDWASNFKQLMTSAGKSSARLIIKFYDRNDENFKQIIPQI